MFVNQICNDSRGLYIYSKGTPTIGVIKISAQNIGDFCEILRGLRHNVPADFRPTTALNSESLLIQLLCYHKLLKQVKRENFTIHIKIKVGFYKTKKFPAFFAFLFKKAGKIDKLL